MKKLLIFCLLVVLPLRGEVLVGIDRLFDSPEREILRGKRVGLITNPTGVNHDLVSTIEVFKCHGDVCELVALFGPEHGVDGAEHAAKPIDHSKDKDSIPIYSLHGASRRPSDEMLRSVDVLVFDIQDVGVRCYTYISTLFYAMEGAKKWNKKVIVLDRPNPINGVTVDGPMLDKPWRSFIGYVDVPLVHGMTVGELALFFNKEYKIGCDVTVVTMKGWNRKMTFSDTGLPWISPSPQIPEADTAWYYPTTNLIGQLTNTVSTGVGYTLPFKVVAAPHIDADNFAQKLNEQSLGGVRFVPCHYRPFFGAYKGELCHGVRIVITDYQKYRPVATQFLILGTLKTLYPKDFQRGLDNTLDRRELFNKAVGSEEVYKIIHKKKYIAWELITFHEERRNKFLDKREKYLLY